MTLTLVLADLYKVLWTDALMVERAPHKQLHRRVYSADGESGREGMRLLLSRGGVSMRAMGEADWDFLVSLCDGAAQAAYATRGQPGSPFTPTHARLRAQLDGHIAAFLASPQLLGESVAAATAATAPNL